MYLITIWIYIDKFACIYRETGRGRVAAESESESARARNTGADTIAIAQILLKPYPIVTRHTLSFKKLNSILYIYTDILFHLVA